MNILIVEDNIITAKSIGKAIQRFGYELAGIANSYNKAMDFLKDSSIDLIILDINLGDKKDGIHIAKELNENYKIPYIFLTSYNDTETINKILTVNPIGYINKPFSSKELKSMIELANLKLKSTLSQKSFEKNIQFEDSVFVKIEKFTQSYINFVLEYPFLPQFIVQEMNNNSEFVSNFLNVENRPNPIKLIAQIEKEIELKTIEILKIQNIRITRTLSIISNPECYKSKAFEFFYKELLQLKNNIEN